MWHIGGKSYGEKQWETELCKWVADQGDGSIVKMQTLLITKNDRKLWRAIFACVLKGHIN